MQHIITKEFAERLKDHLAGAIDEVDEADALFQELLSLPVLESEPVAIYQYQMANGSWIDQDKRSYDYNVHRGKANVRIVYTRPAPFTPITADMVTDEVVTEYFAKTKATDYPKHFIAAAVNAWGAKK